MVSVRSLFSFAEFCVLSSFTIISIGKRELVAYFCCVLNVMPLLSLFVTSSRYHGSVVCNCDISWSYPLTFCIIYHCRLECRNWIRH